MTFNDFKEITNSDNWYILVWNKHHAYKISGRAVDKSYFEVQSLSNMDYKRISEENYEDFEVQFSGEMQAAFHFMRKAIMEELSYKLGNSL